MQATEARHNERDLRARYAAVRAHTFELCSPLQTEDYIPQPSMDVSPIKWNIAHTTWFFEEMVLKAFVPGYTEFDPKFGYLFNSYYNSIGERTSRDRRGDLSRPTVEEVFDYRRHVDREMDSLLATADEPRLLELVELGLNHEQQHQELFLTDLKFTFSQNPLYPAYREGFAPEERLAEASNRFLKVEGGIYEVGHAGDGFCFDNELGRHKVWIDDLEISSTPVTNGEFIEFIEDGGYADHRLWHSEGWDWVNENSINSPLYWCSGSEGREHFTLGGIRPLPEDAPVCHISFYEAAAYADWRGMRLPTEAEWEVASALFEWGLRWEWTHSAYLPYPGFNRAEGAVGEYNGKFMINQMVLRGSSIATPEGHSRPTYRNFFHPHLRWQFTGLRLAR